MLVAHTPHFKLMTLTRQRKKSEAAKIPGCNYVSIVSSLLSHADAFSDANMDFPMSSYIINFNTLF